MTARAERSAADVTFQGFPAIIVARNADTPTETMMLERVDRMQLFPEADR